LARFSITNCYKMVKGWFSILRPRELPLYFTPSEMGSQPSCRCHQFACFVLMKFFTMFNRYCVGSGNLPRRACPWGKREKGDSESATAASFTRKRPDCDPEAVVRAEGVEPSQAVKPCGFSCLLRLSPPVRGAGRAPACGLWSGLSLHLLPVLWGLGAARLVSTPSRRNFRPGLARDCHFRFPRIWAVLHRRFPGEHSSFLKCVAVASKLLQIKHVILSNCESVQVNV
jgi:hypothetical protein